MLPGDNLDAITGFVWSELTSAASDGESRFRHAQFATTAADGSPQLRTVILRHVDASRRELGFHTHRRSAKIRDLSAKTSVALVAYDRPRGLQIRIWGQAEVHTEDAAAEAAWVALYPPLRTPYRAPFAPGHPLDEPSAADPDDTARNPADPADGFENFAYIAIRVDCFEWLQLRPTGHRRARFDWQGTWRGRWLAP